MQTSATGYQERPQIIPSPLFHDHAVLQRDMPIAIWGQVTGLKVCGHRIRVRLGEGVAAMAETTVNPDGTWLLRLPPQPAGGPFSMVIEAAPMQDLLHPVDLSPVVIEDVLVGDVWICSGQSNMEYILSAVDPDGKQSAGAFHPHIRLLTVGSPARADRQHEVVGKWSTCTPETLAAFSAVGGWFGRTLHRELDVPVGLITNAWGGTRVEAWLSREALMGDPDGQIEVASYERKLYATRSPNNVERSREAPVIYNNLDEWFQAAGPEDPVNRGLENGWASPAFDDSTWASMDLPQRWQDAGHDLNGIFWFRRRIPLPSNWKGRELTLRLGSIDKHDETYVNGQFIGGLSWELPNSWCTPREYRVPATITTDADELVIAVRVRSHQYHGGMTGPASTMNLQPAQSDGENAISLHGTWSYAIEQNWGLVIPPTYLRDNRGPGGCNAPYTLFHSRLCPLIPYTIRGWTWYQGESNTDNPQRYRRLLRLMIEDWRRAWGLGNLPFILVQLANHRAPVDDPSESDWAELRSAQSHCSQLPNVGMAVAIDVGEAFDIHPKDKKTVGERLARWALARVYGRPIPANGPVARRVEAVAENKLRIHFDHAHGLRTRDGKPVSHLAVAGANGVFKWAESRIVDTTLEAWHPEIQHPVAVRYAWADNPEGCNLVNSEDLPASPFDSRDL